MTPPPPKQRRSNENGQAFQSCLELTLLGYRSARIADLEKIDPPLRVYGTGAKRNVIFLNNPWLDYGGAWTANGGRAIYLEAKSTEKPRLGLGTNGVSDSQLAALRRWHDAGAAAAVVWGYGGQMKIITAMETLTAFDSGAKSVQWHHLPAIHRGTGLVQFQILEELAARLA